MIGCSCGGFTKSERSKTGAFVLTWETCGSCGRCDNWELRVNDATSTRGQQARREYRHCQNSNVAKTARSVNVQ